MVKNLLVLFWVTLTATGLPAQTVVVKASLLKDKGAPMNAATISFTPNGAFRIGGGGQSSARSVDAAVSGGRFVMPLGQVADMAYAVPNNVCYKVTARAQDGTLILGPGYERVCPSSTDTSWCSLVAGVPVCDFDRITPGQKTPVSTPAYPSSNTPGTSPVSIAIGQVQTLEAGSPATAGNAGNPTNFILNLGIPRGATGAAGSQGLPGAKGDAGVQGLAGAKGDPGAQGAQGIPGAAGVQGLTGPAGPMGQQGQQGLPGIQGLIGPAATVSIGTVSTGAAGSSAVVTNVGTPGAAVLNITIPRGADGAPGSGTALAGQVDASAASTQNGASSNGVANASASGTCNGKACLIVVPPTYAFNAEHVEGDDHDLTFRPLGPQQAVQDLRGGANVYTFADPSAQANGLGATGLGVNYLSRRQSYSGAGINLNAKITSPGYNLGNAAGSATNPNIPQGWFGFEGATLSVEANSQGITGGYGLHLNKYGIGDVHNYWYLFGSGGFRAASDEMLQGIALTTGELTGPAYTGTVTAVTGNVVTTTPVTGSRTQGVGRFAIDTTAPLWTGYLTGVGQLGSLPVSTATLSGNPALPVSHVWGTLSSCASIPPTILSTGANTVTTPTSCTVAIVGGSAQSAGLVAGDLVPFAGGFHEAAKVLSSTTPSGGSQNVVFAFSHNHQPGEQWMQSSFGAGGLDVVANDAYGLRYVLDVLGATAPNQIAVVAFAGNASYQVDWRNLNLFHWNFIGPTSNTGGVVTMQLLPQDVTQRPVIQNYPLLTISGTGTAFDGPCLNARVISTSYPAQVQCSQTASTGLTTANAGYATLGSTGAGNGQASLFASAQVLDVQNYYGGGAAPAVDGTLRLEPNALRNAVGDTIEQPHDYAAGFVAHSTGFGFDNVYASQFSAVDSFGVGGRGIDGHIYASRRLYTNPCSLYVACGGTLTAPHGYNVGGTAQDFGGMDTAPWPAGSPFNYAGCDPRTGDCSDPLYNYDVFTGAGFGGANLHLNWNPKTGVYRIDAPTVVVPNLIASKATALAATPTSCAADQKLQGVDAQGNALGCSAPSGGSSSAAITGLRFGNGTGADTSATPVQVRNSLATPEATQITGGVGTGAYTGVKPDTPAPGNATFTICFDPTTGAAALDTNNLAGWCVLDSNNQQSRIGAIAGATIRAMQIATDPNCGVPGADTSHFFDSAPFHCALPAGALPQYAGQSVTEGGSPISTNYINKFAGATDILTLEWTQNSGGTVTAASSMTNPTSGASCSLVATQMGGDGLTGMAAYACANVPAGTQTFTATFAGSVNYPHLAVWEWDLGNLSSPVESASASTANGNLTCPGVTTTGSNEIMAVFTYGLFTSYTPASGFTKRSGNYIDAATQTLSTAGTVAPQTFTGGGNPGICISMALKPTTPPPTPQFTSPAGTMCSATTRNTTMFTPGNATTKDTYQVCAHDAANTYAWRTIY